MHSHKTFTTANNHNHNHCHNKAAPGMRNHKQTALCPVLHQSLRLFHHWDREMVSSYRWERWWSLDDEEEEEKMQCDNA